MKLFLFLASLTWAAKNDVCDDSEYSENKPGFCTDITDYHTFTNSWVCKNCFNVRINVNLKYHGAVGRWFDNKDYVWIAIKKPVSVIKWAGPVDGVWADGQDDDGNYRFKIGFNDNAEFGDRRIDVNIEFNGDGKYMTEDDIEWVWTCPCGVGTPDGCDPAGIPETASDGFWKCGWHRSGTAQNRMNRCKWTCMGPNKDPLYHQDDWMTGAKYRCFREQGKHIREGTRKQRELFTWVAGRNSAGLVHCVKADARRIFLGD